MHLLSLCIPCKKCSPLPASLLMLPQSPIAAGRCQRRLQVITDCGLVLPSANSAAAACAATACRNSPCPPSFWGHTMLMNRTMAMSHVLSKPQLFCYEYTEHMQSTSPVTVDEFVLFLQVTKIHHLRYNIFAALLRLPVMGPGSVDLGPSL